MDYVGIIENWLKEYNRMKLQSESLQELYSDTEIAIKNGHAIDYSKDKLSNSHKFNSEVENLALDLAIISDRKKRLDSKLNLLDKAISELSAKELQIIRLRYIDRKRIRYTDNYRDFTWYDIENMVGYDERHCRRIKKDALRKLAIMMFGENVR